MSRLGRVASTPLHVAVAAPIVAVEALGSVWTATRAGVAAVTAVAGSLPRIAQQAELLLDTVQPPVTQLARSLDVESVDKLVLSIQAVPDLVASMLGAVVRFEVFVAEAEDTRDIAAMTVRGAANAVAEVQQLIAKTAQSLDRADGVVASAESLLGDVEALAKRVSGVVAVADDVAGLARQIADTVTGLVDMARPVVEMSVDLSRHAEAPVRILLETAEKVAPTAASITPDVLTALRQLSDRLPDLLRRIDSDVLPTVRAMQSTPDDVRALRDSVEEIEPKLSEVEAELAGLPGAKALRRRGRRPDPGATDDLT